jgi:hypothetical protein
LNLCHLLQRQGQSHEARWLLSELLGSLPPGVDSREHQVARMALFWLQEEALEGDEQAFAAPWDVGHN